MRKGGLWKPEGESHRDNTGSFLRDHRVGSTSKPMNGAETTMGAQEVYSSGLPIVLGFSFGNACNSLTQIYPKTTPPTLPHPSFFFFIPFFSYLGVHSTIPFAIHLIGREKERKRKRSFRSQPTREIAICSEIGNSLRSVKPRGRSVTLPTRRYSSMLAPFFSRPYAQKDVP
ncbi:hypothetical protein M0804_011089 [Polistes exclamans]|nr:hypothetical protein M0804_011089 [Polistes exclamans]